MSFLDSLFGPFPYSVTFKNKDMPWFPTIEWEEAGGIVDRTIHDEFSYYSWHDLHSHHIQDIHAILPLQVVNPTGLDLRSLASRRGPATYDPVAMVVGHSSSHDAHDEVVSQYIRLRDIRAQTLYFREPLQRLSEATDAEKQRQLLCVRLRRLRPAIEQPEIVLTKVLKTYEVVVARLEPIEATCLAEYRTFVAKFEKELRGWADEQQAFHQHSQETRARMQREERDRVEFAHLCAQEKSRQRCEQERHAITMLWNAFLSDDRMVDQFTFDDDPYSVRLIREEFFHWPQCKQTHDLASNVCRIVERYPFPAESRAADQVAVLKMWAQIAEPVTQFVAARIRDGYSEQPFRSALTSAFNHLPGLTQRPGMVSQLLQRANVLKETQPHTRSLSVFLDGGATPDRNSRKQSEFARLRRKWTAIMRRFDVTLPKKAVHPIDPICGLDALERSILLLPDDRDFHNATTAVSTNDPDSLFVPYRRGIIGFVAWRLFKHEDRDNLFASLGDFLAVLRAPKLGREKEAIERQGQQMLDLSLAADRRKDKRHDLAAEIAERSERINSIRTMLRAAADSERMPLLRVVEEMESEQQDDMGELSTLDSLGDKND